MPVQRPPNPLPDTRLGSVPPTASRARVRGRLKGLGRAAGERAVEPRFSRFWLRRFRITREGKYFIGITVGVGVAAINTGNNLLYLLLGMLLALIVVSSLMSELSLRDLRVTRRLPRRAQVGRAHVVEIEVHNTKSKLPSYAIEVEDLREGRPADKRCFFLKVAPGSSQVAAYRRTPARRGRDCHVGFRVATRFPFGLFEKSRELPVRDELIVYPATDPVKLSHVAAQGRVPAGGLLARGAGDDFFGVRPMREGEDPRDIYWRKSTLAGHWVLRERACESAQEVTVLLDAQCADAEPDAEFRKRFERQVRSVASRAVAHLKRGDQVRVRTSDGEGVTAGAQAGADPLMRFLALVEPSPRASTQVAGRRGLSDGRS